MTASLILLGLLLALPAIAVYLWHAIQPQYLTDIPTVPGALPLFGHALAFFKHVRENETVSDFFVDTFARPLGPVSQFLKSSFQPVLIIADKRLTEHILTDKAWDRGDLLEGVFGGLAPLGMLALKTDATLRLHKRALAPTMSNPFLAIASVHFSQHMNNLMALWQAKLNLATESDGAREMFWDAEQDLHSLTTDAISHITFGESFEQLSAETRHVETQIAFPKTFTPGSQDTTGSITMEGRHPIAGHMEVLFNSLSSGILPALRHRLQRLRPSYQRAYWGMHAWVDGKITASREKIKNGGEVDTVQSVIDIILQKESADGEGSVLPIADLRDELGTFMLTGEETTSTTMCWILKFMSENPGIQRRLHDELVRVLPSPDERSPTFDEVSGKTTPYLEAFVHEVLRVGQTVRASGRLATRDTTLLHPVTSQPILIPKGTHAICVLGFSCFASSSDPKLGWVGTQAEVEAFKPERWLTGPKGAFDINSGPSLPFALGPRACFGAKMALLFSRLFVAQLSLSFFVAPLPEQHQTERCRAFVTRRPNKNWIGVREWKDVMVEDEGVQFDSAPGSPVLH